MWWLVSAQGATVEAPVTGEQISFETSAQAEVEGAIAALSAGQYDEAARRLGALAEVSSGVELRYLEGLACLEGAWIRCAEQASRVGLARAPSHVGLTWLRGRVLLDLGRGDEALPLLDRAVAAADPVLRAAAYLDRGTLRLDRGEVVAANADLSAARAGAVAAGATALIARADAQLRLAESLMGRGSAADAVGRVGDALGRGDLSAARSALPAAPPSDPRSAVAFKIATALVRRAEGRTAEAASMLASAGATATERGLVREAAIAFGQLAVLHSTTGAWPVARDHVQDALRLVEGTSFRVLELSLRSVAARIAVRLGDLDGADRHAGVAQSLGKGVDDASGRAAASEAVGFAAAARGEVARATEAYDRAGQGFVSAGLWADAARVAVERVELVAASAPAELDRVRAEALALFVRAGDPLGAAHVALAEGLGLGRARDLDGALSAFARAGKVAGATGGPAAAQIERLAQENAAVAMVGLTGSDQALEVAKTHGMADLVARHQRFVRAKADYDQAFAMFEAGSWEAARRGFSASMTTLDELGESAMALRARRGRAWSEYNLSASLSPTQGLTVWPRLVEEGLFLNDPELRVRAMASAAMARGELGSSDAPRALRSAANEAERLGLRDVAGNCAASLADVEPELEVRAAAARRAYALRDGDQTGVYALYSVAVAAFNAGEGELAKELAELALPNSGELKPAVMEVLASIPR